MLPPIKLSEATAARRRIKFVAIGPTGTRLTGLTSASFTTKQISKNGVTPAAVAGTFVEVSSGSMPGVYYYETTTGEVDTLGDITLVLTASGMETREIVVQVVAYDPYDAVRQGMTALPNAAAEAAGGLFTRGTGAGQINQPANGRVDANAATIGANAVNVTAIASGALTFAKFAIGAFTSDVFDSTGLTAISNSVAAKITTDHGAGSYVAGAGGDATAANQTAILAALATKPNAAAIADAVDEIIIEGSNTLGDVLRLVTSVLAGKSGDYQTNTYTYRSLDGAKTRVTFTADKTGRLTVTLGDLTP